LFKCCLLSPAEVSTVEDFITGDDKIQTFGRKIGEKLKAKIDGEYSMHSPIQAPK
jgi:hypothetical protein